MGENPYNEVTGAEEIDAVKGIADALKKVNAMSAEKESEGMGEISGIEEFSNSVSDTGFKVASTNLPAKPSFWTKVKNALFYEIKVELTPYQQKIEDEINEFLHQPITWKSIKEAALSEVPITFRGKRIF
ncbi:MAG: hypothetical protein IJB90_04180 [Clostridia bacterium]|nr:hypothetical protein [Clostridia bacterium]